MKAEPFSIDIGSLNDKNFVYVAAFGMFSDTSYATPQNMKNIFGHAAYVWTCDGEFGGEYKETKIHIHRRAIDLLVVQESEQDEVIE